MRRRALLTAARTALLTTPLTALAGCSGFGDGSPTESPTDAPTASPSPTPTPATIQAGDALEVPQHSLERSNEGDEDELVAVDAVVTNTSDAPVTDVRVVARFFDADREPIDESEARTDRIGADGEWEVELLYPGSGDDAGAVAEYRLVVERDD